MAKKNTQLSQVLEAERLAGGDTVYIHSTYVGNEPVAIYFSREQWKQLKKVWANTAPAELIQDYLMDTIYFSVDIANELRIR